MCYSNKLISQAEIAALIANIESRYSEKIVPTDSAAYTVYAMLKLIAAKANPTMQLEAIYTAEEKAEEKTPDEKPPDEKPQIVSDVSNILFLPSDLHGLLLRFADIRSVITFSTTSKAARNLVDSNKFCSQRIIIDFEHPIKMPIEASENLMESYGSIDSSAVSKRYGRI